MRNIGIKKPTLKSRLIHNLKGFIRTLKLVTTDFKGNDYVSNDSKTNLDLTGKAEAKMELIPTKSGADIFYKRVSFGLAALCIFTGIAWVISAIAPNGFL